MEINNSLQFEQNLRVSLHEDTKKHTLRTHTLLGLDVT
jgi:hypothetical protein